MVNSTGKNFKGLSLHPHDAFKNLAALIEVAGLLSVVVDEEYQELSDVIFDFSKKYALAASEMENQK